MKINEITNAEDMLALWKLISDNTWSATYLRMCCMFGNLVYLQAIDTYTICELKKFQN